MNISKVQAHKLPKAATSTLQVVESPKGKFQFPWLFPFSLTALEFPDFSRFSRWVATLVPLLKTSGKDRKVHVLLDNKIITLNCLKAYSCEAFTFKN